jgi:hypothetical protein
VDSLAIPRAKLFKKEPVDNRFVGGAGLTLPSESTGTPAIFHNQISIYVEDPNKIGLGCLCPVKFFIYILAVCHMNDFTIGPGSAHPF